MPALHNVGLPRVLSVAPWERSCRPADLPGLTSRELVNVGVMARRLALKANIRDSWGVRAYCVDMWPVGGAFGGHIWPHPGLVLASRAEVPSRHPIDR